MQQTEHDVVLTQRLATLARSFARDESASTIAEYALVMAVLTISMIVAYDAVTAAGSSGVQTNETNMSTMANASE